MRMLMVGTCSACGTGSVGLRVSASGKCVVAMCDECDAVWMEMGLHEEPHFLRQPDLPCPGDGSSLLYPPARWASLEEASASGWGSAVLEEVEALG